MTEHCVTLGIFFYSRNVSETSSSHAILMTTHCTGSLISDLWSRIHSHTNTNKGLRQRLHVTREVHCTFCWHRPHDTLFLSSSFPISRKCIQPRKQKLTKCLFSSEKQISLFINLKQEHIKQKTSRTPLLHSSKFTKCHDIRPQSLKVIK